MNLINQKQNLKVVLYLKVQLGYSFFQTDTCKYFT